MPPITSPRVPKKPPGILKYVTPFGQLRLLLGTYVAEAEAEAAPAKGGGVFVWHGSITSQLSGFDEGAPPPYFPPDVNSPASATSSTTSGAPGGHHAGAVGGPSVGASLGAGASLPSVPSTGQ